MGATWSLRLGTALALALVPLLAAAPPAPADDLPPLPSLPGPAAAPGIPKPRVVPAAPTPEPSKPAKAERAPADDDAAEPDPASARAAAASRLETLSKKDDKAAAPASKALREVFEERLKWVGEYEKAAKDRASAESPKLSPETQAAGWKSDLERVKAALAQTAKDPDALLPTEFRNLPPRVADSSRAEMKEAIDAAQGDLKDWTAKLELLRTSKSGAHSSALTEARARRDKMFQQVASLKARTLERTAAASEAKTPEARELAREKLANDRWELRAEQERLKAQEAAMALEARKAEFEGLNLQAHEAHVQLARKTLDRMKARYQAVAVRQERDLHQAAVKEKTLADTSDDPLERYRARRRSEMLELEARVLKSENALTTSAAASVEDQSALADHAMTDFTNVKHLLDDGRVSHLDALRLNNDFRRLGAERSRIVRKELAQTAGALAAAENALSDVEMEMINDARDDRVELDNLLDRLPKPAYPKAIAFFEENERKHAALLLRHRAALEALARRAEQAHEAVIRRLRILDDHFGFIRTNLFWVRDEEPIGLATLAQAHREARQLVRAAVRVGAEAVDRGSWGRVSPEFLAATFGLTVLPWPFRRLRRVLSPAPLPGKPAGGGA